MVIIVAYPNQQSSLLSANSLACPVVKSKGFILPGSRVLIKKIKNGIQLLLAESRLALVLDEKC